MKNLILIFITLLCFTKGNAQWYKVNSKTTENINDIFFVDENVGYCIAGDGILKSTDGGDSWNKIYTNNIIRFGYVVAYKDTVIAFARSDDDGINYKYTSVDNGNTWENEEINYYPQFVQLSNNNIFFQYHNESTLKKLSNGIITTIGEAFIYGVNKNEIVYVDGSRDSIYKSVNSGLTWKSLARLPLNFIHNYTPPYAKIKSFNDTIIYRNVYPNYINISYDNGKNWVRKRDGGPWVNTIEVILTF